MNGTDPNTKYFRQMVERGKKLHETGWVPSQDGITQRLPGYYNPWTKEVRTRLEHISQQACCDCGSSLQAIAGRWHQRQWRDVVEDEQEEATGDKEVVLEDDLSGEEADSAGPVQWMVPAWEVLVNDRAGWLEQQHEDNPHRAQHRCSNSQSLRS
jgi:hypothetical protein